ILRGQAEKARQEAEDERSAAQRERDRARRLLYVTHMQLSQPAAEQGNVSRLESLLVSWVPLPGQPDLRGWEWYYLLGQAHRHLLGTLYGQGGEVWSVAWSPDGARLASAGPGAGVLIWDPATGKAVRAVSAPRLLGALVLAYSPDGKLLATGSADR